MADHELQHRIFMTAADKRPAVFRRKFISKHPGQRADYQDENCQCQVEKLARPTLGCTNEVNQEEGR